MKAITICEAIASLVVVLAPSVARAQDATHQNAVTLPRITVETGLGAGAPSLATTTFTNNGYKVLGSQLGLSHSALFLFETSVRDYPFKLKNFGFLATVEMLLFGNDNSVYNTPTGPISGKDSGPTYYSVELGPEAQARFGPVVVHAAALLGWRDVGFGAYDALDWRASARAQVDYMIGGNPNSLGLALGVFGGADVLPALGWTAGVTFSYALF